MEDNVMVKAYDADAWLRLRSQTYGALAMLAVLQDRNVSDLLNDAIREYLKANAGALQGILEGVSGIEHHVFKQ